MPYMPPPGWPEDHYPRYGNGAEEGKNWAEVAGTCGLPHAHLRAQEAQRFGEQAAREAASREAACAAAYRDDLARQLYLAGRYILDTTEQPPGPAKPDATLQASPQAETMPSVLVGRAVPATVTHPRPAAGADDGKTLFRWVLGSVSALVFAWITAYPFIAHPAGNAPGWVVVVWLASIAGFAWAVLP